LKVNATTTQRHCKVQARRDAANLLIHVAKMGACLGRPSEARRAPVDAAAAIELTTKAAATSAAPTPPTSTSEVPAAINPVPAPAPPPAAAAALAENASEAAPEAPPSPALAPAAIWEVMVQSHQALFFALDQLSQRTTAVPGEDERAAALTAVRAEADTLFALMKLHARIEDAVFFPAVEAKQAGVTAKFGDDHKRSGEGRPALLALLDAGATSEEAYGAAMEALRKFCAGNRAHQLAEEEAINGLLTTAFTEPEASDVVRRIASLDAAGWGATYVPGILARLRDPQRLAFLRSLQMASALPDTPDRAALRDAVQLALTTDPPVPCDDTEGVLAMLA
jgi:hypothetical protein